MLFYLRGIGYVDNKTNNVVELIDRIKWAINKDITERRLTGSARWNIKVKILLGSSKYSPNVEYCIELTPTTITFDAQSNALAAPKITQPILLTGHTVEELLSSDNRLRIYMMMS